MLAQERLNLCYHHLYRAHFGILAPWLVLWLVYGKTAWQPWFDLWSSLFVLYVMASFLLLRAYVRGVATRADVMVWQRRLLIHNLILGFAWGLIPWLVKLEDMEQIALLSLLVAGPWFGAAFLTASCPRVFLFWSLPQLILFEMALASQPRAVFSLALIPVGYLACLVLLFNGHRLIDRMIRLRFDNLELVSRAQAAYEEKSRFLTAISHDLRQPLQAMKLYHATLRRQLEEEQQLALLDKADRAVREMDHLLHSLLEKARLETRGIPVRKRKLKLKPFLLELAEPFRTQARQRGLELRIRLLDVEVETDPVLLGRVLRNLLSNALRYTPRGGVLLACRRRGDRVQVSVYDTGEGISAADEARLFEEFTRLGSSSGTDGHGLGLAITHGLCQLLQHPLHCVSRPGRGTVFSLSLPCAR